ncbi:MAG: hypothetical protein HRT70_09140 [Flavobacteriaceae bacterium]|nr:hypothetical protein [Flavobacteriaceae bacterium]
MGKRVLAIFIFSLSQLSLANSKPPIRVFTRIEWLRLVALDTQKRSPKARLLVDEYQGPEASKENIWISRNTEGIELRLTTKKEKKGGTDHDH